MKLNKKNKLLIAGFIVSLYICYAFAFSNTVDYYKMYTKNTMLADSLITTGSMIQQLKFKEMQLDKFLNENKVSAGNSFQNVLLKQITSLSAAYNLTILQFAEPIIYIDKNSKTYSYVIKLQGTFNGMVMLINAIENMGTLGTIANVDFIKQKNYKTNSDYLTCNIILQRAESITNNTTPE